jgi:hypothetical protein
MKQDNIEKKKKAISLRLLGYSYTKISKILNVSKSNLNYWLKIIPVPKEYTSEYKEKIRDLKKEMLNRNKEERIKAYFNKKIIYAGYYAIHTPIGYEGVTYSNGRYVYEHRYIMEQKIGRLLNSTEIVHHIDGNKFNNYIDNLILVDSISHGKEHSKNKKSNLILLKCFYCGNSFERELRKVKSRRKCGQKREFCSNVCLNKWRSETNNGKIDFIKKD